MNFFQPIAPVIRRLARLYTSKERNFSFSDIKVKVKPGVFHPGLFLSTKMLLNFVNNLNLKQKSFLEPGAGTGIISILAAKKGANVYATDISKTAIDNIKLNAGLNNVNIEVIHSDLFENIPEMIFDFIIVNPPYYKKDPQKDEEFAWYCGADHEYFIRLFDSLHRYINKDSKVYMILSEVCDIEAIREIGSAQKFQWKLVKQKSVWGEKNFIYRIFKEN